MDFLQSSLLPLSGTSLGWLQNTSQAFSEAHLYCFCYLDTVGISIHISPIFPTHAAPFCFCISILSQLLTWAALASPLCTCNLSKPGSSFLPSEKQYLAYAVGIPSPPCTEYMCVQPCDHNGSYHLLEWISDRLYFPWAPKSLQMVTTAMKLKDACSLEENL